MPRETRTQFEIGPQPDQIKEGNSVINALRAVEDGLRNGTVDKTLATQQLQAVERLADQERIQMTLEQQKQASDYGGFINPAVIIEISARTGEIAISRNDQRQMSNAANVLRDARRLVGQPAVNERRGGGASVRERKVPNINGFAEHWRKSKDGYEVGQLLDEFHQRRVQGLPAEQRDSDILLEITRRTTNAPNIGQSGARVVDTRNAARADNLVYAHAYVLDQLVRENVGRKIPAGGIGERALGSLRGILRFDESNALDLWDYDKEDWRGDVRSASPAIVKGPHKLLP